MATKPRNLFKTAPTLPEPDDTVGMSLKSKRKAAAVSAERHAQRVMAEAAQRAADIKAGRLVHYQGRYITKAQKAAEVAAYKAAHHDNHAPRVTTTSAEETADFAEEFFPTRSVEHASLNFGKHVGAIQLLGDAAVNAQFIQDAINEKLASLKGNLRDHLSL